MIRVHLPAADDVAELIDALHTAADACEDRAPELAHKRRDLANQLGDALDNLPTPIPFQE